MKTSISVLLFFVAFLASTSGQDSYLALEAKHARKLALSTRIKGQVGGSFDLRIRSTDRSYNYKLRATWMTPEVIRANARLLQLSQRLTEEQAKMLVAEAEDVQGSVVMVEIDPREGSGVIPRDWRASLQPRGNDAASVGGALSPDLRDVPALAGAARRDYSYDLYWVVFPLAAPGGTPLFGPDDKEAELVVQIYNKVGKVHWPIPDSIRALVNTANR